MNPDLKWALSEFRALANGYKLAREYYEGTHRLAFATEKFRSTFGALFSAFSDNLMPVIVETPRDRLKLDSFTVENEEAQEKVAELWRRNRMKKRAGEVHLDSFIEGDAYVVVWPDDEDIPILYPNRGSSIVIQYDDQQPGFITKAAKQWITPDKNARLTLYYSDRIEKYITKNKVQGGLPDRPGMFVPLESETETAEMPNPYDKVPVFHFGNRTSIGQLGRSELSDCIPLQDALNKTIADMLVGSEFHGLPQRWAIGLEDMDAAEAGEKYKLQAGGVWGSVSKDTSFGAFPTGDLSQFVGVINDFRKEIARVSRTPLHHFTLEGTPPSGESMKTAEAPLTAKVEDRQTAWGMVWSDVMRFALEISRVKDAEPEPVWIDTTPRSEIDQIDNAIKKVDSLGVDMETAQKELGYSDKDIEHFTEERAKNAAGGALTGKGAVQTAPLGIQSLFSAKPTGNLPA
ncbi:MAG: phage portal protein [Acidobacteriota bacterium]